MKRALHPLWLWLLGLCVIAACVPGYLQAGTQAVARPVSSDFYKFYLSGQRLDAGKSPYWLTPPRDRMGDPCHSDTPDGDRQVAMPVPGDLVLGGEWPCLAPNLNPPLFTAAFAPLSRLPYGVAWWAWAALSVACAVWSAWMFASHFAHERQARALWACGGMAGLVAYQPTLEGFALGQVTLVLMPLLVGAWHCWRRGRAVGAGMALGAAVALKPLLVVVLLLALGWRCWRVAIVGAATALALTAASVAFVGLDGFEHYAKVAGNVSWTASNWNGSWFGMADRYFIGRSGVQWPEDRALSKVWAATGALVTVIGAIWASRRALEAPNWEPADAILLVGLPVCLLVSPLGWMYYFPWLLPGVCIAWQRAATVARGRTLRLALSMFVIMTAIPIGMKPVPTLLHPTVWYGVDAWYFHALIVLLAVVMVSAAQKRTAP